MQKKQEMETYTLTYLGDLRVKMRHDRSGTEIITDAPVDNEGKGESFSPTDLLSASLGGCIISVLGIIARRQGIPIEGLTAKVSKTMAAAPRRVSIIDIELNFPAGNYTDKEKTIFQNAVSTCPVILSLHDEIIKNIKINYL